MGFGSERATYKCVTLMGESSGNFDGTRLTVGPKAPHGLVTESLQVFQQP